jgi:hypothetical protein
MRNTSQAARPRIARRSLSLSSITAVACAMALSACAPNSPPLESRPDSGAAHPEARICQPDRALLSPPSAPDCQFRRSDLKTVDPDGWTRLKVEYERQCYRNAERVIREHMRRLQAAIRCES